MINNLFGAFLNFLLFLSSYLIPKKKGLYLVGARRGNSFAENSKYLYLYANKQKTNKKFVWTTNNEKLIKTLKEKNLPVVKKNSLKGFWYILHSEKIVFSSGIRDIAYFSFLFGRFKFIDLWHGNPIKSIKFFYPKNIKGRIISWGLKEEYKKIDFVLHTCEKNKKVIEEGFLTKKIKILGYPRNDSLINPTNFERLPNISKYKKVFFYMPTFRDKKSSKKPFSKQGLIKLNNLMKKNNNIFLIKKHFAEKNWESIRGYSNILDISKIDDAYELLPFVDILITDYSSVCCDFSLLEKPIIFYPYDYEEYISKSRKMFFNYFVDLPGPFVKTEKDFIYLIKNVNKLEKDKKYKEKLIKFKKRFNDFLDSNSSKRVYTEIIK